MWVSSQTLACLSLRDARVIQVDVEQSNAFPMSVKLLERLRVALSLKASAHAPWGTRCRLEHLNKIQVLTGFFPKWPIMITYIHPQPTITCQSSVALQSSKNSGAHNSGTNPFGRLFSGFRWLHALYHTGRQVAPIRVRPWQDLSEAMPYLNDERPLVWVCCCWWLGNAGLNVRAVNLVKVRQIIFSQAGGQSTRPASWLYLNLWHLNTHLAGT